MNKILLIDDDAVTHALVQNSLGGEFKVISCYTLREARELLTQTNDFHALIVDRGLPDGDGLSICQDLKQNKTYRDVPVLFLSSAGSEMDKVGAFFAGAVDYITKPFSLLELKARLQVRLKKSSNQILIGEIELNLATYRAFWIKNKAPEEIHFTPIEFKLLAALSQPLDRVFNRESLLTKVWGENCHVTDRVVDTHMSHLRKKIAGMGLLLESLRGEGYRLSLIQGHSPKS